MPIFFFFFFQPEEFTAIRAVIHDPQPTRECSRKEFGAMHPNNVGQGRDCLMVKIGGFHVSCRGITAATCR